MLSRRADLKGPRYQMTKWFKFNYQGKAIDVTRVEVNSASEVFSIYTLEDGSTVRMKPVVLEILRAKDLYGRDGHPLYIIKSQNVVSTEVADELKRREDQ